MRRTTTGLSRRYVLEDVIGRSGLLRRHDWRAVVARAEYNSYGCELGGLAERAGQPAEPLFVTQSGTSLSRDAVEHRLAKYIQIATRACPSLGQKTISMHVLRHSAAMRLLQAGIETSVIALWLGHEQVETTNIYLHADMGIKERALAATAPAVATPGRFRPNDKLLAFLEAL